MLQGYDVIGIDVDANALEGAKKNLEWGKFSKDKYQLIKSDSRKVQISDGEVIATEPNLGEVLRKLPSEQEINLRLKKFESLMIGVLNNMKDNVSGRIVFTSPYIKEKYCNIDELCSKTRLRLVEGPFFEFREGQMVGRAIFVLE